MNILDFTKGVRTGEIDIVDNTQKSLGECKKINSEYHYFNIISDELALSQANELGKPKSNKNQKAKLLGVPVSVKDCICVKGVETTSGSKVLKGYKPVFDATVIEKIKHEGGIIIGKTSQDEFGFGGFSTNVGVGYKIPLNPFDKTRCTGGSSGGSAGITQKADFCHVSLTESTGGSIVNPAGFCGVFGLCPTYGRVSRYGLLDYGNSLDKIGVMSKYIEDIALTLEIISGYDDKDSTSANIPVEKYSDYLDKGVNGMKIGLIRDSLGEGTDDAVKKQTLDFVGKLKSEGAIVSDVFLPVTMEYGLAVYYLIATSEASTNLAKYCGMRYGLHEEMKGNFNEYFSSVREHSLGEEAKRRIMLGTFARMAGYRDAYYLRAAKVRTLIIEEYKKLFRNFDVLISPTVPILPPKFSEIEKLSIVQNYMIDILTVGPNLAGVPHMNIPVGFHDGLPVGVMAIAGHFREGELIRVGNLNTNIPSVFN